jgi:DDE superfamily endonuclease
MGSSYGVSVDLWGPFDCIKLRDRHFRGPCHAIDAIIGGNALLMHDNARPHAAHIVRDYLNEANIDTLQWPARSPDLNCIGNLWDRLKRSV